MLTDSISQFEATAAAHIPKSLQKLIHNLQKANLKKPFPASRNPPLNISMKKQVPTRKQKNNKKPPRNHVDLNDSNELLNEQKNIDCLRIVPEVGDEESVASTSSKPDEIDNQKWSEFLSKIDDDDLEIWTEKESLQKTKDNVSLVPSNNFNDASKYNKSIENNGEESNQNSSNFTNSLTNERNHELNSNWRTFNEMVQTNIENFFPEKSKQKIITQTYTKRNLNPLRRNLVKKPSKMSSLDIYQNKELLDNIQAVNITEWISSMKEENEMLKSMVQQVKSVNYDILKARQEISKFHFNR